jgi:hypothetical protein
LGGNRDLPDATDLSGGQGSGMAEIIDDPSDLAPRLLRSTPFALVVFCFLLPFFSLSSCDGGTETDATGFQIVAGSRLIREQVKQPLYLIPDDGSGSPAAVPHVRLGPIGPDAAAQTVADAARPWVALTLIVVALGGCVMVTTTRRWRGIRAIAAGLALSAWVGAAIAADNAGPTPSRAEFSLEWGFGLPLLILIVTCVYGVWALARGHDEQVDT